MIKKKRTKCRIMTGKPCWALTGEQNGSDISELASSAKHKTRDSAELAPASVPRFRNLEL